MKGWQAFCFPVPRHVLVAATAWISGGLNAVVLLLSIRLLTDALGAEAYAAYCVLAGMATWIYLLDLGIAASLQNHVSELRRAGKPYHDFVVTSAVFLASLALAAISLLILASPWLAGCLLRRYSTLDDDTKQRSFVFVAAALAVMVVGNLAYRTWYAEQKGYVSNVLASLATAVVGLALVLLVMGSDSPPLLWVLAAYFSPTSLSALLSVSLVVFRSWRAGGAFRIATLRQLLDRALGFWLFALLAAGVLGTDYLILSQLLPPQDVVIYSIAMKVTAFGLSIYTSLLGAFWPVSTEMAARNDWGRLKSSVHRHLRAGLLLAAVFTLTLLVFRPYIMGALAPQQARYISGSLLLLTCLYLFVRVWTDTFANVMLSTNNTRPLLIFAGLQALVCGLLQYLLTRRYGIHGIVLGLIGSYLMTVFWGLPWAAHRYSQRKLSLYEA